MAITMGYAQGHQSGGKWCCLLKSKGCDSERYLCPACEKNENKKREDKAAEDKRRADIVAAKIEADKKTREIERKKELAELAEKNKVTEVFVTMPKSASVASDLQPKKTSSISTSTPSSDSDTSSPSSSSDVSIYNNIYAAENVRKYNEQKALVDVTTGIIDLFSASPEKQQRDRDAAFAELQRYNRSQQEIANRKEEEFKWIYSELIDKAKAGDENYRMLLYFAGAALLKDSYEYLPDRREWIDTAIANNNTDALVEFALNRALNGRPAPISQYNFEKSILYFKKAADLGSRDAMMLLAHWYDSANYSSAYTVKGGNNPELALEWFQKAAKAGSPNAMYYLGMIYTYGRTINFKKLNMSGKSKSYYKQKFIEYNIDKDENLAFEWFSKSLQPDYQMSLFSKARYNEALDNPDHYSSYFEKGTYIELAEMYSDGKVVPKDKVKSAELENLYRNYINTQTFEYIYK
ncbi:hypothetical protein FLACOL7796_03655 [Flavobacterium collinsii]|uniref:Secretory immunoglobulin A-binding protein EsiB n=2 Tax=Flavobacterium collinsii TaxID=1114861 RepID=A0ABN7ERG4_9FLAO|nr:hypothetical protein FLACOL7796_03655 [Flavobacterium collinsii]